MEKTAESLAQEVAAMKDMLSKVSTAIDVYAETATKNLGRKDVKSLGEVSEKHVDLFMATSNLMSTVRGPMDMVFSNFENVREFFDTLICDRHEHNTGGYE